MNTQGSHQHQHHETPDDNPPTNVIKMDEEREKRAALREGIEQAEVNGEVDHEHALAAAAGSEHPEDVDKEELRIEIMRSLDKAQGSKARIQVMARFLDTYGIDAILGFFFPEIGDAAVSGTVFVYLFGEAIRADLPKTDIAKIAWYQLIDFAIGSIPLPGDVGDYFYTANIKSAKLFEEHRDKLVAEALEAGISEEEIGHLLTAREETAHTAETVIKHSGKFVKLVGKKGESGTTNDTPDAMAA